MSVLLNVFMDVSFGEWGTGNGEQGMGNGVGRLQVVQELSLFEQFS